MPRTLDINEFAQYVIEWGEYKYDDINRSWSLRGGWEGWVQVDLANYINQRDPRIEILREQPIYTDNGRVDQLYNVFHERYEEKIAVEIKTESFENYTNFERGLNGDIDKLQNRRSGEYRNCIAVVLGIAATPNGEGVLQRLGIPLLAKWKDFCCGLGVLGRTSSLSNPMQPVKSLLRAVQPSEHSD